MIKYLKQRALELLKENQQALIAPYKFKKPKIDGYILIIVDDINTYHYFYQEEGELQYDGWGMDIKRFPMYEIFNN